MMIQAVAFFKCLSDETRLRCVALLLRSSELCVCELAQALRTSQPKISRHLAVLRSCGLLQDQRQGAWVNYRIHPELPHWALAVLKSTQGAVEDLPEFQQDWERLQTAVCKPASPANARKIVSNFER